MDNFRFINLETYEITENPENYIYADKDIVETIAVLNKKGYKTISCCSGHADLKVIQWIEKKEELEKEENIDKYYYKIPTEHSDPEISKLGYVVFQYIYPEIDTYILFDKEYQFSNLPNGFKQTKNSIRKKINVFNENKESYEMIVLDEKIKKTNEELLEWAKELKEYKG